MERLNLLNLLKTYVALFFVTLLIATFFWLWGRFGYSFWAIPLIVLFIAAGFILAQWVRQQNHGK